MASAFGAAVAAGFLVAAGGAAAQQAAAPAFEIGGYAARQGDTDLTGTPGTFSYARFGLVAEAPVGPVTLSFNYDALDYDFSPATPPGFAGDPDRARSFSAAVTWGFRLGQTGFGFAGPTLAYRGENGVGFDDAVVGGVTAGAAWQVGPRLRLGAGVAAETGLAGEDTTLVAFPILAWDIADRLRLETGGDVTAPQGDGLDLRWDATERLTLGASVRFSSTTFQLNEDGPTPGGVVTDESVPVALTAAYALTDTIRLAGFAGMTTNGSFTVNDRSGAPVGKADYDTAPLFGLVVQGRF